MPPYDPARHHRRSIRLRGYDYRQAGAYFVTISSHHDEALFGAVVAGTMHLNAYGEIVAQDWAWLAETFPYVDLDAFIVMPNHVHGIVVITAEEEPSTSPPQTRHPLGRLVGVFKTMSTKHVNEWRETPGEPIWHRNYYEHIIRDDADLRRIRDYIATNPARWSEQTPRTGDA